MRDVFYERPVMGFRRLTNKSLANSLVLNEMIRVSLKGSYIANSESGKMVNVANESRS